MGRTGYRYSMTLCPATLLPATLPSYPATAPPACWLASVHVAIGIHTGLVEPILLFKNIICRIVLILS